MVDFITFAIAFVSLNIALDVLTQKVLKIHGLDFLFIAPWIAAFTFGLYEAAVVTIFLVVTHIILSVKIANYILLSSPAMAISILIGNSLGAGSFWLAMIVYYLISSTAVFLMRGFGGRYISFVILNIVFNLVVRYIYFSLI